jgi:RNA polymerase sigma-70 factor, ECF subfamily
VINDESVSSRRDRTFVNEPGQPLDSRAAREAFVRDCYAELFQWFCRLTGSADRAADLTQETFAAFWQAQGRLPEAVSPRAWLYAIGRNLWRKQARDRKSFEPAMLGVLAGHGPSPEQVLQEREFRKAAERAVSELPEELREVFTLRFWQELSFEEIGAIQDVSADLARWRYFTARRRLHEKLAAWGPNPRQAKGDRHAR